MARQLLIVAALLLCIVVASAAGRSRAPAELSAAKINYESPAKLRSPSFAGYCCTSVLPPPCLCCMLLFRAGKS